jgi:bifunctional oligoribonuclease and PAP phosphatase NrnA
MIYLLLEYMGPAIWTTRIASCLYLAIMTDTGGFRYGNTTANSLRVAASLVEKGANPEALATAVWRNRKIETLRLIAEVMKNLHFELDGRLVWAEITQDLFRRNGGEENEPDNLTSDLRSIRGVEVALLVREMADGGARASLRSAAVIDVSRIAAELGGGGHTRAAGCETRRPYGEALPHMVETVIRRSREQFEAACS